MKRGMMIDPRDNVGIVTEGVISGDQIEIAGKIITVLDTIELPHKMAMVDLKPGDHIIKYGMVMGYATCEIKAGQHVHVHNVDSEKMMK